MVKKALSEQVSRASPVLSNQGCLYVVATPIGNLADITKRAIKTLKQVDLILAENTRHSAKLLSALGIKNKLSSYHDHNEKQKVSEIISLLEQGKEVALISDAGTPLISDPGYRLIRECHQRLIKVIPVPGVSALTAALSVSGLATDLFFFNGFLPRTHSKRIARLGELKQQQGTLVFYESPHRLVKSLTDLVQVFGRERRVVFARELTKQFETLILCSLGELLDKVKGDADQQKGEFVLLVEAEQAKSDLVSLDKLEKCLIGELPPNKAAKILAAVSGKPKKAFYKRLIDSTG